MFDKFKKQLLCCKPTRLKYPPLPPNTMSTMKALAASEPQRAVSVTRRLEFFPFL